MWQNYLQQLKNIKKLEPQEERNLWIGYKEHDDPAARQELIKSYLPLVFKIAWSFNPDHPLMMDMIQEGTIGLIEAVENFDLSRDVHFSVYARHRIRGRMLNFLADNKAITALSLDQPIHDGHSSEEDSLTWMETLASTEFNEDLGQQVENKMITQRILQTMEKLPSKEQEIIQAMYLQDGEAKKVAQEMEISLPHLYRLQKKAIQRMRGMLSRFMAELKR